MSGIVQGKRHAIADAPTSPARSARNILTRDDLRSAEVRDFRSRSVADQDVGQLKYFCGIRPHAVRKRGAEVAHTANVGKYRAADRRLTGRADRRKNSRGGRRSADPHTNWRRIAWLFAFYAMYLSVRSLPATLRRLFKKDRTATLA